jgi:cyclase
MDRDGTAAGYDLALIEAVARGVNVPVIASGGAGGPQDLAPAIQAGADAVLCASIFHYGRHTVAEAKQHLGASGISVRPVA